MSLIKGPKCPRRSPELDSASRILLVTLIEGRGSPPRNPKTNWICRTSLVTFIPDPGSPFLQEPGDMVPESVTCLCLHTLTSAVSGAPPVVDLGDVPFRRLRGFDAFLPQHCWPSLVTRVKWPEHACSSRVTL